MPLALYYYQHGFFFLTIQSKRLSLTSRFLYFVQHIHQFLRQKYCSYTLWLGHTSCFLPFFFLQGNHSTFFSPPSPFYTPTQTLDLFVSYILLVYFGLNTSPSSHFLTSPKWHVLLSSIFFLCSTSMLH